jgi:hypothetical protein
MSRGHLHPEVCVRGLFFLPVFLLLPGISAAQQTTNPEKVQNESSKTLGRKLLRAA